MSKIVLSVDNGNSHQEEAWHYLNAHDCKIYTLSEKGADIETLLTEIERKEGRIDMLLLGVKEQMPEDGKIGTGHDCGKLLEVVSRQIDRAQEAIEAALPLMRRGGLKRIGLITRKDSSISGCGDVCNYGQHMAWAGLNMVGKIYFNLLRPEGFTFRWYCAEENAGGMSAGEYMLQGLCYDEKEPYIHSDENRLVMRDSHLREIPW